LGLGPVQPVNISWFSSTQLLAPRLLGHCGPI
jgi:hypothetical protein